MTPFQEKVLAGLRLSLARERKNLERDAALVRFAEISLTHLIERHRSNIKLYEQLIAHLERK
jgi:hypothetical protein